MIPLVLLSLSFSLSPLSPLSFSLSLSLWGATRKKEREKTRERVCVCVCVRDAWRRHSLKRAWRICGALQTLPANNALAILAPFRPLRASIVAATLAVTAFAAFEHLWRRHVAQVANARLRKIHKQT